MISDNSLDDKENYHYNHESKIDNPLSQSHPNQLDDDLDVQVVSAQTTAPNSRQAAAAAGGPIDVDDDAGIDIEDVDDIEDEDDVEDEEDDDDVAEVVEESQFPQQYNTNASRGPANVKSGPKPMPMATQVKELAQLLMKPIVDYPIKDANYNVWQLKNWSGITEDKIRGPKFVAGGFEWNVLLFPKGNNNNYLSIYIEPHPLDEKFNDLNAANDVNDSNAINSSGNGMSNASVDNNIASKASNNNDDWYVCAQFMFDLWNPDAPQSHLPSSSYHRFNKNETDWGFSSFIDLNSLYKSRNSNPPILANDQLNITAYVNVIDDSETGTLWHNFLDYDSKKSTGYVGLNNQGATCYLNSLLQSYFTTKIFRKLVYQIPTTSNTIIKSNKKIKKQSSVALSLQRIFYLLSHSDSPVGTLELTKAFGWDSNDAFTQHDIQELNRILMDKLELSMKSTPIENKLNDLFVGKMKSFIKCINVPYESSRVEDFWDIQLNVKGFSNLQDSFKNYIELEMLTDDNKYQAGDEYGYQDAKKGVVFERFPPILHLQLKRFEYDFMIDDLQKINDFYQFPDKIDLSPYLDEDLPEGVKQENWNYKLHGVLVHQGSISNGHYYAMIKPLANEDRWFRFEDDKVWKVTKYQAFDENFGANELSQEEFFSLSKTEQAENLIRRSTSAYMLVYYRETDLALILPDNDEEIDKHVPSFIPVEIENQLNEIKMIENLKLQQLYNLNVKVVNLQNFQHYKEFDYYYDPTNQRYYDENIVQRDPVLQPSLFNLKKTDSIYTLYNEINRQLQVSPPGNKQLVGSVEEISSLPYRLLLVCHRNNHTNRVDTYLNLSELLQEAHQQGESEEDALQINLIYNKLYNKKFDEMVFFLEEFKYDLNYIVKKSENKLIPPTQFDFNQVINKFPGAFEHPVDIKADLLDDSSNNIIIFLKYFDVSLSELKCLTHMIVAKDTVVLSVLPHVQHLLNFSPDVELEVYEELTPTKLESTDIESTFEKNELSSGDILVFQVKNATAIAEGSIKSIVDYFKFISTKLHIQVSPIKYDDDESKENDGISDLEDIEDDGNGEIIEIQKEKDLNKSSDIATSSGGNGDAFEMYISSNYNYQDLSREIASKINQNPEYLRIFIINQQGLKYPMNTSSNLSQYFPKSLPISTTINFEYEVLNISLQEFENMKSIRINWVNKILDYHEYEILISITDTVKDLVETLLSKLPPEISSSIDKNHLLMWGGNDNRYVDFVKFNKRIDSINESLDYYIGQFPVELNVLMSHDMLNNFNDSPETLPADTKFPTDVENYEFSLSVKYNKTLNIIPVYHFYKNSTYHHSVPFLLVLFPNELWKDTKKRLQFKLGISDSGFSKIKFAIADKHDKGKYLDNNDNLILYSEIDNNSLSLALDHVDKNSKKSIFDKGIQIK